MASAITMVRTQPQGGRSNNNKKPPPPPPPPKKKPPPPPPPPSSIKAPPPPSNKPPVVAQSTKRPAPASDAATNQQPLTKKVRRASVSIQAPIILRDVNVFLKKHQVGQGTYGYVMLFLP